MAATANTIIDNDNLFGDQYFNTNEYIMSKIKECDVSFILNRICHIYTGRKNIDSLIINYKYFKYFANSGTYEIIIQHIINNIDTVLQKNESFIIHLNMKSLTISQLDKHRQIFCNVSSIFKERYPDTLGICYVYDAPFIFSGLYDIIGLFVDKITLNKIQIVTKV
jgi:hypothetical protein